MVTERVLDGLPCGRRHDVREMYVWRRQGGSQLVENRIGATIASGGFL
jgi:hypothetical protein